MEKQTSPDGAAGSFTFTGDAAGSIGDSGTITVSNLVPGTYTSTEADPKPSFDLGAIVCDDGQSATPSTVNLATRLATFKLDPGETVTCVFTNVQRGTITIIKDAQPDSDAGLRLHHDRAPACPASASMTTATTRTPCPTPRSSRTSSAGAYSVTESDVAGWDLSAIDCNVSAGSSAQTNMRHRHG